MKKYLLIIALILVTISQTAYSKELFETPEDLENMPEIFYEAPNSGVPAVQVKEGSTITPVRGMPLFKKTRIKVTNFLRERDYKKYQKELEKQDLQDNADENSEEKTLVQQDIEVSDNENTLELEGGVKEHVASNEVLLDADNIEYNDKTFDIIATGSPVLVFPPQSTTIKAEKMIYNKASNILKAFGSVEVIKEGNHIFGDYLQINMNEENAFLDNMNMKQSVVTVTARKSEMQDDKVVLHNGKIVSEDSYILNLHTKMIGGNNFNNMIIDDEDKSSIEDIVGNTAVHIKAKEIFVNAKKNHDVITLKKAQIQYGDAKLFNLRSFSVHTNKKHEFFDANYPELGSRGRLGMFAGPGFVFDTPLQNGSTVKLLPIINNDSGIGFGGMLKYRSATNYTDLAYGSASDVFIMKGKQYLDDKLYLQYGANSYLNEWFFGPRMPKYAAELIYHDKGVIPSTIGKDLDLNFRHRFGIGYMQNNDVNRHGEHLPVADIGTMRTRYMAEISQSLFNYADKEKLRFFNLALIMQGSAALYGTGDTQFVGRIGPRVHTQYKYWMQDIGFFATAYQDGSPMQMYDSFRYGHANVYVRESLRVHKYLTLAWSGTITFTDNPAINDKFQENSFIIAIGPDDIKFNIGYDWVRRQTYFAVVIAMDTKGSSVEYEKMEIKNPDRLAKNTDENVELKVFDMGQPKPKGQPKKMMYAEVIDIEDPSKEEL